MSYTIITTDIPPRADGLPWDANAPGLYTASRCGAPCTETVVQLDTGETVAVSVEEEFQPTTLDVGMIGWARHINADGSSKTMPDGTPVEVALSVGVSKADADQFTMDAFRKEMLLAVLGEPAQATRPIVNQANAAPMTQADVDATLALLKAGGASPDAQVTVDPNATTLPLLAVSDQQRLTGNVRNAIATYEALQSGANAAALLG